MWPFNLSVRLPIVALVGDVYKRQDVGHRMLKKRLLELEGQTRGQLAQDKKARDVYKRQGTRLWKIWSG